MCLVLEAEFRFCTSNESKYMNNGLIILKCMHEQNRYGMASYDYPRRACAAMVQ